MLGIPAGERSGALDEQALTPGDSCGSNITNIQSRANPQKEKTTVKKNSLHPKFGEKLWLMCQEPASQLLYIVVKDIDLVNVKVGKGVGAMWLLVVPALARCPCDKRSSSTKGMALSVYANHAIITHHHHDPQSTPA